MKNTFMLKRRWRDEDDDAERVDKLLVSSLRRLSKEDQYYREEESSEKKKRYNNSMIQVVPNKAFAEDMFVCAEHSRSVKVGTPQARANVVGDDVCCRARL